jgi:hypothetical protein
LITVRQQDYTQRQAHNQQSQWLQTIEIAQRAP